MPGFNMLKSAGVVTTPAKARLLTPNAALPALEITASIVVLAIGTLCT
jgi:hypothetical protein